MAFSTTNVVYNTVMIVKTGSQQHTCSLENLSQPISRFPYHSVIQLNSNDVIWFTYVYVSESSTYSYTFLNCSIYVISTLSSGLHNNIMYKKIRSQVVSSKQSKLGLTQECYVLSCDS